MESASNGGFQTPLSGPESEPVRVRSVEDDDVDGSLIQTVDPGQYAPVELVPDLSAGTAGSAIPVQGSAPRPAATYPGGSVLPASSRVARTLTVPDEWLEEPARVRSMYDDEIRRSCRWVSRRARRRHPSRA